MTRSPSIIAIATLAATFAIAAPAGADTLVVHNVNGYTLTRAGLKSFRTIVVTDGKVEQILGTDSPNAKAGATVVDGAGNTLLPGLTDAHGHVLGLGQERLQLDLRGTKSAQEAVERVRSYAAQHRDARWIIGHGWNQVLWKGQQFPTAAELDAVIADRPVLLNRVHGHAIWVNSAAMKAAGVTAATAEPSGGQIIRVADNQPSGVFVDAATPLIEKHVPQPTDAETKQALLAAMHELASLGLTGVHDAGIDPHEYELYQQLGAAGELPIRIYAMLADSPDARKRMQAGPALPEFEDRLQMRAVKSWADGALGSRGAALLQDYSDEPHHRGLMIYKPEELQQLAKLTASKGWQLNVHAIGDAGNRLVLDTLESQLTAEQRRALRPRIEHAQVLALDDIARLARLGVIASIQPTHATSDMNMAEARLGPERIKGAYAWRKLLDAGARLAGGSDFPVELPNPFYGLYAAVTRQDRNGQPPGGWYGGEKLTREEALRLFTLDAAYAGHMENALGSLEPGKWADFILVDRDYFKVPDSDIDDTRVLATYVGGRRVGATSGKASSP